MERKILAILLLFATTTSGSSFAGVWDLTHHSRANCGNNETISWQAHHNYWLWVNSRHRHKGADHQVITGWVYTWRAASVHWGEGFSGDWTVEGHHWMRENEASMPFQVAEEFVEDCSIYDGWWD